MTHMILDLEQKSKGLVADIPGANGEFVPNGKSYFDRMGKGEIITDAPVFDYFHLQSYGKREDWEWRLQDVHGFIGEYPTGGCWYLSDRCKQVFEQFNIAKEHHFYATKLFYKGKKLDYWIFQYAGSYGALNKSRYINFKSSSFFIEDLNEEIIIDSYEEYISKSSKIYDEYEKDIVFEKLVLKEAVDFIPMNTISADKIVSEKLKNAIENAGLRGVEFSELNYKVVIE